MPTKRTKRARPLAAKITTAAVEAYKAGDRRELYRELRLRPWQISPVDARDGPCPCHPSYVASETWPQMQALRAALEEMSDAQ